MLRVTSSVLRAGFNQFQLQQCMKISTTKAANLAAVSSPQPQTNPDILYTGVRIIYLIFVHLQSRLSREMFRLAILKWLGFHFQKHHI